MGKIGIAWISINQARPQILPQIPNSQTPKTEMVKLKTRSKKIYNISNERAFNW